MLPIGAFLFLWNFNPFSNTVLHLHMTRALGFSERFYGWTVTLTSIVVDRRKCWPMACIADEYGCLLSFTYRLLGVVSTLGYALVVDERRRCW